MKDEELKLEEIEVSLTLGGAGRRTPRNLSQNSNDKSMMSRKTDKALKKTPNIFHLGRIRRKKDKGRS